MDDKTKQEYKEKANEQTSRVKAEGMMVPKRKKNKKSDDRSFIIDDYSVTSTGKIFVNLIIVNLKKMDSLFT